jgi:hypothetical protein
MTIGGELYQLLWQAMDIRASDPDEAIRLLTRGKQLAEQNDNKYWMVTFDHWRLQVLLNYKRDFTTANRLAVEAAIEARKPVYQQYSSYICVQQDMILVYKGIDPIGYAPEIKEAIDLTLDQTSPGTSCYFCLRRSLADYYTLIGDTEEAKNRLAEYYALTSTNRFYRVQAVTRICVFTFQEQAWSDLRQAAQYGASIATDEDSVDDWLTLKAWEMIAQYHLENKEEASKLYFIIQQKRRGLKMVPGRDYYQAVCAYHEATGDLAAALAARDEQLSHLCNSGQYYWECECQLERIRLLKQMGQPYGDAVNAVYGVAQKLKSHDIMQQRIENIAKA